MTISDPQEQISLIKTYTYRIEHLARCAMR